MKTYQASQETIDRLENDFKYHAPVAGQPEKYVIIRDKARDLAYTLITLAPASRELSLALTKLDEVVMHTNSAIARHEQGE
jgi:hypothetical protein